MHAVSLVKIKSIVSRLFEGKLMFHVKQYSFFIDFLLVYSISINYCMKLNGSEHEQCSFDTLISKITIDKFCF